jgi:AAA15 family ATPase/GTPase
LPQIIEAIRNGNTLVVDELDSSMHTSTIVSLISVFHNDDINVKHAQLVFSTHNPIYLSTHLFRRDEIKFVDRDEETNSSIHYTLTDISGSGAFRVRKKEDVLKNYLSGEYGAFKLLSFSEVFENLTKNGDE